MLFRMVLSPTPYGLPSPSLRFGVRNSTPKLQSLLSQERLKLRTAYLADTFTWSIRTQAHEEKGAWGRGRIQRWTKFFEYPLLSQERVKLQTSNLAGVFKWSIRTKAHENFWRKGSVGVSRDYPNFWSTLLSQDRVKPRTSNLAGTFTGSIRTKAH